MKKFTLIALLLAATLLISCGDGAGGPSSGIVGAGGDGGGSGGGGEIFGGSFFHVTYDGNTNTHGATPVDNTGYIKGNDAMVRDWGALVKTGHTFTNWNTRANGSGETYNPHDLIPITGDVTLYAQWKPDDIEITYYTVTFVTSNAQAPAPLKVAEGSKITQPVTPSKTSDGYNAKVSRWNTNLAVAWDFDTDTVNDDMTLTAVWTNFAIGDTGPGGGTIVHRDSGGFTRQYFTMYGENTVSSYFSATCYYLEAAPKQATTLTYAWASTGKESESMTTDAPIGYGRHNTGNIIGKDRNAPAAKFCVDYRGGNKNDWFLPSLDELKFVYDNRFVAGYDGTASLYWTSTQEVSDTDTDPATATARNMYNGDDAQRVKSNPLYVIPMRAF